MTQLVLKIGEQTSLEEVCAWPSPLGRQAIFVLAKASGFEAGAEGTALSYLSVAVSQEGLSVELQCEFSAPTQVQEFLHSPLCSVFGFTLIRSASVIRFSGGHGETEKFKEFAGKYYDAQKGVVGLGDHVSLIAFDPKRRVPRALLSKAQTIDHDGFPLPSAFHTDLLRILSGMGLPEIGTQATFPVLLSFVYELFLNTVQHGLPSNRRVLAHSTRGIVLTKLAFNTQHLAARKLSKDLKDYLSRIAEIEKREKNLFVVCISVMDMGDGIQNTLPSQGDAENSPARLLRAFEVGQTRKGTSSVERGIGLNKVVQAALRLGARLQVCSAGQRVVKDFSLGEDHFPNLNNAAISELPPHFSLGTSVDMFLPRLLADIDQRKLGL